MSEKVTTFNVQAERIKELEKRVEELEEQNKRLFEEKKRLASKKLDYISVLQDRNNRYKQFIHDIAKINNYDDLLYYHNKAKRMVEGDE